MFLKLSILLFPTATQRAGGPNPEELLRLLDQCDLSISHGSTPCPSPCPSLPASMTTSASFIPSTVSPHRLKASNLAFLNTIQQQPTSDNNLSVEGDTNEFKK